MPIAQAASVFPDVPAWPDHTAGPAPRTHNRPPPEEVIPIEFKEALLAEKPDFYTRLDQLLGKEFPDPHKPEDLGSVHRARCEDDESLARCGDLVKALLKAEQHVDAVHKSVKAPYLAAGRLVDAEKNALVARISPAKKEIEDLQKAYQREQLRKEREAAAERQRLIDEAAAAERAREQAERARLAAIKAGDEAAAAAIVVPEEPIFIPPPPAPSSVPIRSDAGATVSRILEWKSEVQDYERAFKHVKADAKVREAIDAAIQRHVKATKGNNNKPLAGVRMWEDVKPSNR